MLLQDAIALVIQSIGGAIASYADTLSDANRGGYIALGKLLFLFPTDRSSWPP